MQPINPEVLRWARETAGLTHAQAVKKLKISATRDKRPEDRLKAIETGREQPEPPILKKMAKYYHRPLITFYLEKPPRTSDYGVDYRKISNDVSAEQDAYLKILVRDMIARQGIVNSLLEEDDATEVDFVGTISQREGKHHALEKLRVTIELESPITKPVRDFKKLRDLVEKLGVFVLLQSDLGSHHTSIDTSTFRGFVLADRLAPFIVINGNDASTARSFTLLHEMVHLLLGDTGISRFDTHAGEEEQFCNDVAGEYLLPSANVAIVEVASFEVDEFLNFLGDLSKDWNLSRLLIAYRLYRMGKIERTLYEQVAEIIKQQWQDSKRQKDASKVVIDYSVMKKNRLGNSLVNLVERYIGEGVLSTTKAAVVMGVKPTQVGNILGKQTRV